MKRRRAAYLILGAVAAVGGCGSDADTSAPPLPSVAEIDTVVHSFAAALADERVDEACTLLTKSGQEKMTGRHGSCANGARVLSRNIGQLGRRLWRDVKVVNVDGTSNGVVVAHISPRAAPLFADGVKLRRVSGTWLVDP